MSAGSRRGTDRSEGFVVNLTLCLLLHINLILSYCIDVPVLLSVVLLSLKNTLSTSIHMHLTSLKRTSESPEFDFSDPGEEEKYQRHIGEETVGLR